MIPFRAEPQTLIPINLHEGEQTCKGGHSGAFQGEFTRGDGSGPGRLWSRLKSVTLLAAAKLACLTIHRGRNIYPTGIDSTSAAGHLGYGAEFTHQLKITGGPSYCLYGSEVSEEVAIDRDDFKFRAKWPKQGFGPIALGKVIWTLGLMKKASPIPDRFTDTIATGGHLVKMAMPKSPNQTLLLPAIRKETQKLYWRRKKNDPWRLFATVKISFQVVGFRNQLSAQTKVNSVSVTEAWSGPRP